MLHLFSLYSFILNILNTEVLHALFPILVILTFQISAAFITAVMHSPKIAGGFDVVF